MSLRRSSNACMSGGRSRRYGLHSDGSTQGQTRPALLLSSRSYCGWNHSGGASMTDEVRTAPKDVHVDEVRDLVALGEEEGWLTADEIADALGSLDLSAEQVDNVYALVAEEGIEVVDHGPGADAEDVEDFRRDPDLLKAPTNHPVRMYLKEIGKVPLLTAEQEVDLAMRIEAGLMAEDMIDANADVDIDAIRELARRSSLQGEGRKPLVDHAEEIRRP